MKLWIRVDASAPVDPKMGQLADALNVQRAHAFGLVTGVWCAMAAHAVDGNLTGVSDRTLEEWAGWTGRRGVFAAAFRTAFLNEDAVMGGWNERQGKLLDRMERDRKRHQKPPTNPHNPPRSPNGNSEEIPRSLHGNSTSTVRNGTEQNKQQDQKPSRADARTVEKKPPKHPHFPDAVCDRLYAAWSKLGRPNYGSFRNTFSRLFPEVPPFTVEQVERAIGACIEDAAATGRGEFVNPSGFVDRVQYWVDKSTPIAERDPARAFAMGIVA